MKRLQRVSLQTLFRTLLLQKQKNQVIKERGGTSAGAGCGVRAGDFAEAQEKL